MFNKPKNEIRFREFWIFDIVLKKLSNISNIKQEINTVTFHHLFYWLYTYPYLPTSTAFSLQHFHNQQRKTIKQ